MIGDDLENAGWRQGSIVKLNDVPSLIENETDEKIYLIVTSHSCDIANNNLATDPYIEVSIAREISHCDGNYTNNKNPRIKHSTLMLQGTTAEVFTTLSVEIMAHEKACIDKQKFVDLEPDDKTRLTNDDLYHYIQWLGARYTRPALPTEFNNRLADCEEDDKKIAKTLTKSLSGIYVEITPNTEIDKDEKYSVNLLGAVSAGFEDDIDEILKKLEPLKVMMEKANMDVTLAVRKEDEISVAMIKRFQRFYYDDISFKKNAEEPIETVRIL